MNNLDKHIPVKYNNEIVGYTDDGITIQFNDSDAAKKVNELLNKNKGIYVSSRAIGEVKSDNTIEETDKISYDILHFENIDKRYVRNEEEFKKITAEVRNRQYEENPIGVDISGLGGWDSKRFSPTSTYDWDNEYLEIERIDNVDVVKLKKYNEQPK